MCVLVVLVCMSSIFSYAKVVEFPDVEIGKHWAYPYVSVLATRQIVSGYPDKTYKPDNEITYAEFISMVSDTIFSEKNYDRFDTRFDHWVANKVAKCETLGILNTENKYEESKMDEAIPRYEMAKILIRAVGYYKGYIEVNTEGCNFSDIVSLTEDEVHAVKYIHALGIVSGMSDTEYAPYSKLTRAEASTVIYKLIYVA